MIELTLDHFLDEDEDDSDDDVTTTANKAMRKAIRLVDLVQRTDNCTHQAAIEKIKNNKKLLKNNNVSISNIKNWISSQWKDVIK